MHSKYRLVLNFMVITALSPFVLLAQDNDRAENYRVSSYSYPLVAYAPNPEDAVNLVRVAEEVLPEILDILGLTEPPFKSLEVSLKQQSFEVPSWKVIMRVPGAKKVLYSYRDQYDNQKLMYDGYLFMVLSSYMLSFGKNEYEQLLPVPRWIRDGIMVKLQYTKEQYYSFLQEAFTQWSPVHLDMLITDPDELGSFQSFTAASMLDFIIGKHNGKMLLKKYLELVAKGKGQKEAFLSVFGRTYETVDAFGEAWKRFLYSKKFFSPESIIIPTDEFIRRLNPILVLHLQAPREEKLLQKRFKGDFRDLKYITGWESYSRLISGRLIALEDLSVRSSAVERECAYDYINCLHAAAKKDWKNFRKYFHRGEKQREKLQRDTTVKERKRRR